MLGIKDLTVLYAGNQQVWGVDRFTAGMETVSSHLLLGTHVVLLVCIVWLCILFVYVTVDDCIFVVRPCCSTVALACMPYDVGLPAVKLVNWWPTVVAVAMLQFTKCGLYCVPKYKNCPHDGFQNLKVFWMVEYGHLELYLTNKTANMNGKNWPVYNQM